MIEPVLAGLLDLLCKPLCLAVSELRVCVCVCVCARACECVWVCVCVCACVSRGGFVKVYQTFLFYICLLLAMKKRGWCSLCVENQTTFYFCFLNFTLILECDKRKLICLWRNYLTAESRLSYFLFVSCFQISRPVVSQRHWCSCGLRTLLKGTSAAAYNAQKSVSWFPHPDVWLVLATCSLCFLLSILDFGLLPSFLSFITELWSGKTYFKRPCFQK